MLVTPGLTFVQKKVGRGNWLEFTDTDLSIGIAEMERAFIQHFDDRSIQVTHEYNTFYEALAILLSTQVSNMKMRKDKNRHWSYHAEVFTKGILRVSGKRRVDLNIRIVKDGVKDDREFLVYNSIFHQIKQYLSTKYANHSKVDIYLDN